MILFDSILFNSVFQLLTQTKDNNRDMLFEDDYI